MEIKRTENGNQGEFYTEENGKQIALMTYKKSGENEITIDHTEVDESLQGKGVGKILLKRA
jgi:predicted GNAT family acetyltransferase